jgi:Tat protein secretion system quality control protein TatD with DNase activity
MYRTGIVQSHSPGILKSISTDLNLYISFSSKLLQEKGMLEALKDLPLNRLLLASNSPLDLPANIGKTSELIKTKFQSDSMEQYDPLNPLKEDTLLEGRNEPCTLV